MRVKSLSIVRSLEMLPESDLQCGAEIMRQLSTVGCTCNNPECSILRVTKTVIPFVAELLQTLSNADRVNTEHNLTVKKV